MVPDGSGYRTLDLWVRDLAAQVQATGELVLFAPVASATPADWVDPLPVPSQIRCIDVDRLGTAALEAALAGCDVVQVPGNFSWRHSAGARRFMRVARSLRKPTIVGISSNRARTEVLNAAAGGIAGRLRSWARYVSIRVSQSYLVWRSAGVFVVGEGLRELVAPWSRNVFVGTASWIRHADIGPARSEPDADAPLRLCVAARLEPMKGIRVAIAAMSPLAQLLGRREVTLEIAGSGPEEAALRELALRTEAAARIAFVGTRTYPERFFALIRNADIVLLTNLNDEQPRLVFDAISQGCIPICPDSLPYRSLGIPVELLYAQGDAEALAQCIAGVARHPQRASLRRRLRAIAQGATIEAMHLTRERWVRVHVLAARH